MVKKLIAAIDKQVRDDHNAKPVRGHLGPSVLGRKCARQVWYGWRWFNTGNPLGRMLRLWQRGHDEEFSFVRYLRSIGAEVRDYETRLMYHDGSDSYALLDWDADAEHPSVVGTFNQCDDVSDSRMHIERATARGQGPKQWGFKDSFGHFKGSSDGKVNFHGLFPADIPQGWGGLEFKTANEKSFKDIEKKGVLSSKPEHYNQMQVYMHKLGVRWCLYMAVNKNNDDLYAEIIMYKREVAEYYIDRAYAIIPATTPPPRITEDPSWFACRWCDFKEQCHKDALPQKNCRSCAYAAPILEGQEGDWLCHRFRNVIPKDFMPQGCDDWDPLV